MRHEGRDNILTDGLLAGCFAGVITALAECAFHLLRQAPTLLPSLLPPTLALYIFYWGIVGLLVAIVWRAVRSAGIGKSAGPGFARVLTAGFAIAFTLHTAFTSHVIGALPRPWSTLLFAGVLALALLFAVVIQRVRSGRALGARLMFGTVLTLFLLSLPLAWIPERGAAGDGRAEESAVTGASGPNVLLVVFDTMRYDHIGSAGYARPTTPVIDSLAAGGAVFERAYAPSSWTLPSTASILTSRYPSGHGVTSPASALSHEITTLPAILRDAGYRTGLFSGNPLVEPNFGFGNGFGHVFTPSKPLMLGLFYLPRYWKRTFGRIPGMPPHDELTVRYESIWRPHVKEEWIRGGRLGAELLDWVDADGAAPFFAHVQIMEPHDPYEGTGRFGPAGVSEKPYSVGAGMHPFDVRRRVPDAEQRIMVDRYDDDVLEADRVLGEIVRGLEARGLGEETWIIVTSDHGEEFWDHDGWGHARTLFDEVIRVPLMIHGRGAVARKIPALARLIDIGPTVLAIAGRDVPPGFVGTNLLPVILGNADSTGIREAYAELWKNPARMADALVTDGGRKIIRARDGSSEEIFLFDLYADESEKVNRARGHADEVASLLERLDRIASEAGADGIRSDADLDEETRRRLKSLGYIE
ncbi:MAG: sulfatase [Gemmatimonadetes bacterium]|nr:sulfatase [Gemmatimonadota bacterium]